MIPDRLLLYYPDLNVNAVQAIDPLFSLLASFLSPTTVPFAFGVYQMLVFLIGGYLLFQNWGKQGLVVAGRESLAAAILSCATVLAVSGGDVFLQAFAWAPWLLWSGSLLTQRCDVFSLGAAAAVGVIALTSFSALGPLWLLFLGFLVLPLCQPRYHRSHIYFFVLFVLSCLLLPESSLPTYPEGATLAPLSGYRSFRGSLFGTDALTSAILSSGVQQQSVQALWRVLSFALLLAVCARFLGNLPKQRSALGLLFVTALLIAAEVLLAEEHAWLSPFFFLYRVIPGASLLPIPAFLLPIVLWAGVLLFLRATLSSSRPYSPVRLSCLLLPIVVLAAFLPKEVPRHFRNTELAETGSKCQRMKLSPSGFAVRTWGSWTCERRAAPQRTKGLEPLLQGRDFQASIESSPQTEAAHLVLDGDPKTRWRTARAQQAGDFLQLSFDREIRAARASLLIPDFASDFPRGIEVLVSRDGKKFSSLLRMEHWLGPVRWTSLGYPYFGPQGEVVLDFARERKFHHIRFVQIGQHPVFDWSVAEVQFERFKKKNSK